MPETPIPDDDLAAEDREFRAAMGGGDLTAAGSDPGAAEEAARDRAEFLAHLAAQPPAPGDSGTSRRRRSPRRTPTLRELRRRAADPTWSPDAQIDLHGRTRDRARGALERFIAESLAEGLATVLVVVGQGHHSPGGEGLVGRMVRQWLTERGLRFLPAPPRLGGEGALLVSLSRADRE